MDCEFTVVKIKHKYGRLTEQEIETLTRFCGEESLTDSYNKYKEDGEQYEEFINRLIGLVNNKFPPDKDILPVFSDRQIIVWIWSKYRITIITNDVYYYYRVISEGTEYEKDHMPEDEYKKLIDKTRQQVSNAMETEWYDEYIRLHNRSYNKDYDINTLVELYVTGTKVNVIAKKLGISRQAVYYRINTIIKDHKAGDDFRLLHKKYGVKFHLLEKLVTKVDRRS